MITLIILSSHAYALSHFRIFKFCMFLNHGSTSLKGASKPYDVLEHHCPCSIQADNLEKRGWTIHSKWMIPITSRHQTSNTHPSMPWSFFFFSRSTSMQNTLCYKYQITQQQRQRTSCWFSASHSHCSSHTSPFLLRSPLLGFQQAFHGRFPMLVILSQAVWAAPKYLL